MTFPFGETVTHLSPTVTIDGYGDEHLDWSNPTITVIPNVAVALSTSDEDTRPERDLVESDYTLFLPPGTNVGSGEKFIVRGDECEVVGVPFDWRHPMTGWRPGVVARVRRISG